MNKRVGIAAGVGGAFFLALVYAGSTFGSLSLKGDLTATQTVSSAGMTVVSSVASVPTATTFSAGTTASAAMTIDDSAKPKQNPEDQPCQNTNKTVGVAPVCGGWCLKSTDVCRLNQRLCVCRPPL